MPASCEALDPGVGMIGRVVDVRPVDERGDAGVDALERPGQVAGVDVLGAVQRREAVEHLHEVVVERGVGGAVADRRLPRVPVRVDEAGDHDVTRDVDHLGVGGEVLPHLNDRVALDQDVAARDVPELRVHREHVPPSQQDPIRHVVSSFDRSTFAQPTARRTPSTIRSTDGIAASSSASADGNGMCGVVTRTIGPSSAKNPSSATIDATSGAPAAQARVLLDGDEPAGPADGVQDRGHVERHQRADVDHLGRDAVAGQHAPRPRAPSAPWRPARRS